MGDTSITPSRPSKRHREYSSPNQEKPEHTTTMTSDSDKVGDMSRAQLLKDLMESMGTLMDNKLSALATKEDVLQLSSKMRDLEEKNEQLRQEVISIKAREKSILNKLVDLEGRSRRNNLIFRGLKLAENARDYKAHIKNFCGQLFGYKDIYVNRAHPLDREGKAIIAHIPDDSDIDYLMTRVKQLKGTGYSIHRDFPAEVREKRATLAALREEVEKVCGRRRMPLVYDHIIIEGVQFTWEEGVLKCGKQDGAERLRGLLRHDFGNFLAELKIRKPYKPHKTTHDVPNIPGAEDSTAAATTSEEG